MGGKIPAGNAPINGARLSRFVRPDDEDWARTWTKQIASRSLHPFKSIFVETVLGTTHVLQTQERTGCTEMICVPGWGTNSAFWVVARNLEGLAKVARLSIVDVPGQPGMSTGWSPPIGGDGYGRWLRDVADGLGLRTVSLMGTSFGAYIVLLGERSLRDRVSHLVICAPAGIVRPCPGLRTLWTMASLRIHPTRSRADAFIRQILGPNQTLPADAHSEIVEAVIRFGRGFKIAGSLPPVLRDGVLREVAADMMLIVGEDDPLFSASGISERAGRLFPNLRCTETLPAHGHGLEFSPVVMNLAAEFLTDTPRSVDASM